MAGRWRAGRRQGSNLLQASENSNFHEMELLRGVYPEELEGLAMTSYGGLIYTKNIWDATLVFEEDNQI